MYKKIIICLFILSTCSHANVIENYNLWQTKKTENNIGEVKRAETLQRVENKLLEAKLDSLYIMQDFEDTVENRELQREYLRSRIWRKNNYRYDYYEDHWAWSAKKWW